MADNSALHAQASDPTTDPARLASLAHQYPSLGALVAANPAAYDGLLDWLLQYGDADAKRAVGVRRGQPIAAAAPTRPMSPTAKKGLLFGGIGLAAVAVVAVAVVGLANVFGGGGGSASGIRIMDIGSEPRDDAWGIITPQLEDRDLDDDSLVSGYGQTVAQDRALVYWTAVDDSYDEVGDALLSLVDTTSGNVAWTVEWDDEFHVISAPGANPYLLSVHEDDGYVVYAINPGNGDVISDTKGLDDATVYSVSAFGEPLAGLGGDVIIRSEDGIGRYSPNDFDEETWLIDLDDDDVPSVAGNRIIIEDTAYSIDTGEEVDWHADDDIRFYDFDGRIIGSEGNSDDASFALYNDAGEEQWSHDTDGSTVAYADGDLLILQNTDDEELIAIDLGSGKERWTADLDSDYYLAGGSVGDGLLVAISDEEGVVIDITSGEEISSFDTDDFRPSVIGVTKSFIYLTGNSDGDIVAINTRTGDEEWTLDNPGDYVFSVLGGNIVGFAQQEFDDAEDEAVMIGIQP